MLFTRCDFIDIICTHFKEKNMSIIQSFMKVLGKEKPAQHKFSKNY